MTADPETQAVTAWLHDNLPGRVVSISRQTRWRPVWFVDLETDHEMLPLMVRGDRTDTDYTWSLEHEMRFQRVMVEQGIAAPRVHGWIDDPRAFVIDRLPGQADFHDVTDEDRTRVVDEYVQELAQLHQLDTAPFLDAGIDAPRTAGEGTNPATLGMHRMEQMFRRQNVHPDPFLEFMLGWWHRNRPTSCDREAPIVWDSGQFMHAGGHHLGIIDVELAHIGDPLMDLAGWRMRDSIMHYGDFKRIYSRYADLVGTEVDVRVVQLHHIAFTISNQLAFSHALLDPPPESDFATNLQWCNETNLYATEGLAEFLDIELDRIELPDPHPSPAAPAFDHLVRLLRTARSDDDYLTYRLRGAFRVARHLQRNDEIGAAVLTREPRRCPPAPRPALRQLARSRGRGGRVRTQRQCRGRPRRAAVPALPPQGPTAPDAERSRRFGHGPPHPDPAVLTFEAGSVKSETVRLSHQPAPRRGRCWAHRSDPGVHGFANDRPRAPTGHDAGRAWRPPVHHRSPDGSSST